MAMMVALAGVVEAGWSQGASTAFTYQGELATAGVPVSEVGQGSEGAGTVFR